MLSWLLTLLAYWPRHCRHEFDTVHCTPAACIYCGRTKR